MNNGIAGSAVSSSQVSVEDDLGSDISGNDWVGQDGAELLSNVERVYYCHLQTRTDKQSPYY